MSRSRTLFRAYTGPLIILSTSALGGAAYRYFSPSRTPFSASLDPEKFSTYNVVERQHVSSTSAIFTLRKAGLGGDQSSDDETSQLLEEAFQKGVWSVQIKQPQLQIGRAYTPLPLLYQPSLQPSPTSIPGIENKSSDLRLLIRNEVGGEVSTYLHRLPLDSTVDLRGPHTELELPNGIKEVIFLAGGTGIAPALQVAHAFCTRPGSKMHILWATRTREDCLGGISDTQVECTYWGWRKWLGFGSEAAQRAVACRGQTKGLIVREIEARILQARASSNELQIQYFVDEENTFIEPSTVARHLQLSTLPSGQPHDILEPDSKLILVSGPDGFVRHWAGEKKWVNGREVQGPLGGILGKLDLRGWNVYKL